jgi:hypothetical protein
VFNATFNNISVILSQTVLLVKKTRKKTTEKLLSHNNTIMEEFKGFLNTAQV